MILITNFITKVVGNLKNNLYICIMSLTKRWIESLMETDEAPYDVDSDEYYCYYSGLISVKAYEENEELTNRNESDSDRTDSDILSD